jgi:hypothetical protein
MQCEWAALRLFACCHLICDVLLCLVHVVCRFVISVIIDSFFLVDLVLSCVTGCGLVCVNFYNHSCLEMAVYSHSRVGTTTKMTW